MERAKVVLMYCADGPYRHVRRGLANGTEWFAWGYRLNQVSPRAVDLLRPATLAELWEVDNTRVPRFASFVASVRLDFVTRAADYLPLTFTRQRMIASELAASDVVAAAAEGWMVIETGVDEESEEPGNVSPASNSATVQEAQSTVPLGR